MAEAMNLRCMLRRRWNVIQVSTQPKSILFRQHRYCSSSTTTTNASISENESVSPSLKANVKEFMEMPALPYYPFIGNLLTFVKARNKNGTGGFLINKMHEEMYDTYGLVVRQDKNLPGKRVVTCFNGDILKAYAKEQKEPKGIFEGSWPIKDYARLELKSTKPNPFLAKGEEWRVGRKAVNPHMFNVKAAKSYLDGINRASAEAVKYVKDFEIEGDAGVASFVQYASLDMFFSISLGIQLHATAGNMEGRDFAAKTIGALTHASEMAMTSPWSENDYLKFGAWKEFVKRWGESRDAVEKLMLSALEDDRNQGFLHTFMKSQKDITVDQAVEMIMILALAAADTTSSYIGNAIFHLSRNQDVQAKLREEVKNELKGQDLQPDTRIRYLDQVLFETQRMTPTLPWQLIKHGIEEELEINGYRVPKDSTILFSNVELRHYIEDAEKFIPERYSPEAVKSRKGTDLEYMDHPAIKWPFSFGSRMCVGSRVAKLEVKSLLCRLVQDYSFELQPSAPYEYVTRVTTMPSPYPLIHFTKIKTQPDH